MKVRDCRQMDKAIERTLAAVNQLLPQCDFRAAYCLGVLCSLAWQDGIEAPRSLLELAAKCPSVEQAVELYREYRLLRGSLA